MSNTIPMTQIKWRFYIQALGVPELEPFTSMHGRLSTRLAEADLIIIIGFAFSRHLY